MSFDRECTVASLLIGASCWHDALYVVCLMLIPGTAVSLLIGASC